MFTHPTTKTEIAKWAVQAVVAAKVTSVTEDQMVQHTELNPDGITVKVSSSVVGYVVASKLKPYTDSAVDTAIERYQTWKLRKQEKTSTE